MPSADSQSAAKPVVALSILPQQYFLERIASGRVESIVLVGPGQSPHSYEPTPRQLDSLSRSSVWILSGTDFEEALKKKIVAQFPALTIRDGTDGVKFRDLDHRHEGHAENHDPHTWLGREPAKIMAGHIRISLKKIDPAGSEVYEKNYQDLVSEIDSVFDSLTRRLAPLSGKTVLVYHPAFGYFFDEFNLHQESVETGGKEPTVRTLAALVEQAKKDGARAIFVQEQFSPASAKRVAEEIGIPVVSLNPLSGAWLENITRMGKALEAALLNGYQ